MSPGDFNIERYKEEEKPAREIKKKQPMMQEESQKNVLKCQMKNGFSKENWSSLLNAVEYLNERQTNNSAFDLVI